MSIKNINKWDEFRFWLEDIIVGPNPKRKFIKFMGLGDRSSDNEFKVLASQIFYYTSDDAPDLYPKLLSWLRMPNQQELVITKHSTMRCNMFGEEIDVTKRYFDINRSFAVGVRPDPKSLEVTLRTSIRDGGNFVFYEERNSFPLGFFPISCEEIPADITNTSPSWIWTEIFTDIDS